jgi:esterase/lipase
MIAHGRTDPDSADRQRILDGNAPFARAPDSTCPPGKKTPHARGILMTHGLTDSPYSTQNLARFFQKNCFRVLSILLPGHGTRPGDLLDVTWEAWARAVQFGVDALAEEADQVYLFGFSTGGALSIYQSLHDPRVDGLFLFAPAVQITPMARLANLHKLYSGFHPKGRWESLMDDEDPFKYESFALNGAYQVHRLTQAIRSQTVSVPLFVVASEDDATVNPEATLAFFVQATHPLNRMILYSTDTKKATSNHVERVNSRFPEQKIISASHLGIVIAPDDPHYGERGDYAQCGHYFGDAEKYRLCKNRQEDSLGEVTEENLKRGVIRRLTYNPNDTGLKERLKGFINTLP